MGKERSTGTFPLFRPARSILSCSPHSAQSGADSWFLNYPAYLVLTVELRDHDFDSRLIHGVKQLLDFFGAHSRLQNGAASKDNTEQCLAHETFDGHLSSGQMNVCRNLQTNADRLATRMCKMARRTAVLV